MQAHIARFKAFKQNRDRGAVDGALAALTRAAHDESDNIFARVVEAASAGVTHGEIIACLRKELGFGRPLIVS
jgi:methylmalonyl-CoA mutase N-terminal domain/subunit